MNKSQRKIESGSTRWVVIASFSALLVAVGVVIWQSRAERVVTKRQESFFEGVERRDPRLIERLLADDYEDRWGFSGADAAKSIVDVGSQFMTLVVTADAQTATFEDGTAEVKAKLTVGGNPVGPVGNEVTRRINRLKEPFVFTWEKQSFLPSSWRISSIDQPELPKELYGYKPGDIRRAMRGE